MDPKWNEDQPIYRQLRDRVVAMILEGVLGDGDALPSVRNVAAEYRLNPLTVLKGYQELVDEGLVEKKRGRGMFVNDGARGQLLKDERQRFLDKEWPQVVATISRLGLDAQGLARLGEDLRIRLRDAELIAEEDRLRVEGHVALAGHQRGDGTGRLLFTMREKMTCYQAAGRVIAQDITALKRVERDLMAAGKAGIGTTVGLALGVAAKLAVAMSMVGLFAVVRLF